MTARRILVPLAVWLLSASLLHGADRPNIVVILADDTPATPDRDTDHAHPRNCGFERQCVFGQPHLRTYGKPVAGEYTPDVLQAWALKFITEQAAKEQPFFLYYASPLPHFPYWPTPLNPDGRYVGEGKMGEMYGDVSNFPYLIKTGCHGSRAQYARAVRRRQRHAAVAVHAHG